MNQCSVVYTSHGVIRNVSLRRGTLSAGAHSRCAAETVVVRPDSNISQFIEGIDVEDGLPPAMDAINTNGITELLVKIAIVDLCGRNNDDFCSGGGFCCCVWRWNMVALRKGKKREKGKRECESQSSTKRCVRKLNQSLERANTKSF
jgi:hypothetical protein